MLKKQFLVCLMVLFGLLHMGAASAALVMVSFDPVNQTVVQGNPVSVDLVISDLGNEILTGFDLEISFDDSILSFQSFTVGPGPTGLDPSGLDFGFFSYGFDLGLGTAAVGDVSVDSDATLQATQPDSFVLGTLAFDTLSIGTSALTISYALLAGELDASGLSVTELQADLGAGSIEVSPIPVPAAIWLFGTGLIGLIGFSKRRKVIQQ